EDGIRDADVTGVQTCALPICPPKPLQGAPDTLEMARAASPFKGAARQKSAVAGGLCLDPEPGKLPVELRDLPAAVDDAVLAGPCRMRLGIDVQPQRVALLAVARAGLELGAVGHDDGDFVIGG